MGSTPSEREGDLLYPTVAPRPHCFCLFGKHASYASLGLFSCTRERVCEGVELTSDDMMTLLFGRYSVGLTGPNFPLWPRRWVFFNPISPIFACLSSFFVFQNTTFSNTLCMLSDVIQTVG